MDLLTALSISGRSMDVRGAHLRALAQALAGDDGAAGGRLAGRSRRAGGRTRRASPATSGGALASVGGGGAVAWTGASSGCAADNLAANLDTLRATRALLSRTVEALR